MNTALTLPLADLAAAINAEHAAAESAAGEAIQRARKAGELLLQAKAQVDHGQWIPWLTANCTVGVRQAQKYIRLVQNWDALANTNSGSYLELGINEALRLIAGPPPNPDLEMARRAPEPVDAEADPISALSLLVYLKSSRKRNSLCMSILSCPYN